MSFSFTRKADYALVALATLAMPLEEIPPPEDGQPLPRSLSAAQIARARGLPPRMVINVLKQLHGAGLVHSRRGARGGYSLARDAALISVAQVLDVMQGPVQINPCCCGRHEQATGRPEPAGVPCASLPHCPITGSIRRLNGMVLDLLRGVTIADLLNPRTGANLTTALSITRTA